MNVNDYQRELQRIDASRLSPQAKKKIKEFLNYIQAREELSIDRLYFYSTKLRIIADIMGKSFLGPADKDVERALNVLKKKGTY